MRPSKIFITVVLLLSTVNLYAAEKKVLGVDPNLIERSIKGKEMIFRRQYDQALRLFEKLEKEYPDSPSGVAGQMAVWQVKMFEHNDFRYAPEFEAAEKRYTRFSRKRLRGGNVPPWDLFIFGAADGLRGFFKTRQGKWLSALGSGLHAMRQFKKLKWERPDFIDVDMAFGAYLYWRSAMTKEIKILPFFSDRRKEGIAMLEKVAREGAYSKDLALGNLVFVWGNEDKYSKAIAIADQLLAMYPENIILRYQKGRVFIWAKKYDQALKMFEEIESMNPAVHKAILYQGMIYAKKKDYAKSKELLARYVPLGIDKEGLAMANYWLGYIEEVGGNKEAAMAYYEKSLKLYKLKEAKKRLNKLRKASK